MWSPHACGVNMHVRRQRKGREQQQQVAQIPGVREGSRHEHPTDCESPCTQRGGVVAIPTANNIRACTRRYPFLSLLQLPAPHHTPHSNYLSHVVVTYKSRHRRTTEAKDLVKEAYKRDLVKQGGQGAGGACSGGELPPHRRMSRKLHTRHQT